MAASAPVSSSRAAARVPFGRRASPSLAARGPVGLRLKAAPAEVDLAISGVSSGLSEEAKQRCLTGKLNPFEKTKLAKCGTSAWTEVYELAELLRKGESTWEQLSVCICVLMCVRHK